MSLERFNMAVTEMRTKLAIIGELKHLELIVSYPLLSHSQLEIIGYLVFLNISRSYVY